MTLPQDHHPPAGVPASVRAGARHAGPPPQETAIERAAASAQLAALEARIAGREGAISLGEIVDGLGRTGIGMTLLLLSLPALIPIPGPFGLVFGSIVALVSVQLMCGAHRLMLPGVVRARAVPAASVRAMVAKGVPLLRRAERFLKPRRLLPLTGRAGRMAVGLPLALMGVAVALPVPLGNVPPVASLIALSLGLMMRDGVAVLAGLALAAFAVLWFAVLFMFGAQLLDGLQALVGWA
jgi:hypothetical protein